VNVPLRQSILARALRSAPTTDAGEG